LLYNAFAVDTVPNLELTPGSAIKQDWQACEPNRRLVWTHCKVYSVLAYHIF